MTTRRFEAASTPAALDAVRAAFGDDAFILSNRRLGERVEIIATGADGADLALNEVADGAILTDATSEGVPTTRLRLEAIADPVADRVPSLVAATNATPSPVAGATLEDEKAAPSPVGSSVSAGLDAAAIQAMVHAAIQSSLSALLPVAAAPSDSNAEADTDTDRTCSVADDADSAVEVGVPETAIEEPAPHEPDAADIVAATGVALSETVNRRLQRVEVALWGHQDEPRSQLLDRLLQLGLGASTAVRLAEQASGADIDVLTRDALARLRDSLPVLRDDGRGVQGVKLLSGPDGDARLSVMLQFAHAAIAQGGPRSVALVSADTSRPGAFPMLEECARSLGCVTIRVRSHDELESTLESLSDRACVLVDAGNAWPRARSVDQHLLVLPAILQRTACEAAVDKARAGRATGCVLSALNEPGRPGEALEALIDRWLPIAYWCDSGQIDVPPRRAEAAMIVAAAIGAARRLGGSEHDRLLGSLLHPGRGGLAAGFVTAVQLPGERVRLNISEAAG